MTATVHSKNYTNDLPITFAVPSQEEHGIRHHLTTDGKQLVLIFPDVQGRLISGSFGGTRLAVNNPSAESPLVHILSQIRDRAITILNLDESTVAPILTKDKGLLKRSSTLYLNLNPRLVIKDMNKQVVDPETLDKKVCKFGVFVHVQSVYQNDQSTSLRLQVNQLVLQSLTVPTADSVSAEAEMIEDPSDLL